LEIAVGGTVFGGVIVMILSRPFSIFLGTSDRGSGNHVVLIEVCFMYDQVDRTGARALLLSFYTRVVLFLFLPFSFLHTASF
jgi:hypothetical protein